MTERRSFDEHVLLFVEFGNRVAQLREDSWARIEARCAALNDPSFGALLNRAFVFAKAFGPLALPTAARIPLPMRIIDGVGRVAITGMAIAGEIALEFESATPATTINPRCHRMKSYNPRFDACIDANNLIESALDSFGRNQPGVATVVRAA